MGEIPSCWGDNSQFLHLLNLSSNKLSGTIPTTLGHLSSLIWLHLNNNNLTSELPEALSKCTNLELLDLGGNNISGTIPAWLGKFRFLRILRLRGNILSGSIPSEPCQLNRLQIMDLAGSNLTGLIPSCLGKLVGMTTEKHVDNMAPSPMSFDEPTPGFVPSEYDNLWFNQDVSAVTKGLDLEYTKMQLQLIDLLDLSNNQLFETIPEELCMLVGLHGLNLSYNNLSGNIPNKIGEMKLLDTLDLSNNHHFGSIPNSISAIPSLGHLNLSNSLSGKIPKGNQIQTLDDPSINAGNHQLCGFPLPECPRDDNSAQIPPISTGYGDEDHEEDKKEKILFYFVILAGYAAGLWGVIGTMVFKRNRRIAYFRFVENNKERLLMPAEVKVARLKEMMQRTSTEE